MVVDVANKRMTVASAVSLAGRIRAAVETIKVRSVPARAGPPPCVDSARGEGSVPWQALLRAHGFVRRWQGLDIVDVHLETGTEALAGSAEVVVDSTDPKPL